MLYTLPRCKKQRRCFVSLTQNAFSCKSELLEKNKPLPSVPFMYWRILLTASMWGSLGSARNWLNQSTTNVMSSLVKVRYNNIPITLLYWFAFGSSFPWSFERCRFCSIGVLTGLDPKLLVSCRISKAYFLWFRLIPLSLLATSSPKIYLRTQVF